jgi:hypothetical protein
LSRLLARFPGAASFFKVVQAAIISGEIKFLALLKCSSERWV